MFGQRGKGEEKGNGKEIYGKKLKQKQKKTKNEKKKKTPASPSSPPLLLSPQHLNQSSNRVKRGRRRRSIFRGFLFQVESVRQNTGGALNCEERGAGDVVRPVPGSVLVLAGEAESFRGGGAEIGGTGGGGRRVGLPEGDGGAGEEVVFEVGGGVGGRAGGRVGGRGGRDGGDGRGFGSDGGGFGSDGGGDGGDEGEWRGRRPVRRSGEEGGGEGEDEEKVEEEHGEREDRGWAM